MIPLNEQMRQARRLRGFSQRELARRMNTGQSAICAYETGAATPTMTTLRRWGEAVDFQVDLTLTPRESLNSDSQPPEEA